MRNTHPPGHRRGVSMQRAPNTKAEGPCIVSLSPASSLLPSLPWSFLHSRRCCCLLAGGFTSLPQGHLLACSLMPTVSLAWPCPPPSFILSSCHCPITLHSFTLPTTTVVQHHGPPPSTPPQACTTIFAPHNEVATPTTASTTRHLPPTSSPHPNTFWATVNCLLPRPTRTRDNQTQGSGQHSISAAHRHGMRTQQSCPTASWARVEPGIPRTSSGPLVTSVVLVEGASVVVG